MENIRLPAIKNNTNINSYVSLKEKYGHKKELLGDPRLCFNTKNNNNNNSSMPNKPSNSDNCRKTSQKKFERAYTQNRNLEKRLSDDLAVLQRTHLLNSGLYERRKSKFIQEMSELNDVKHLSDGCAVSDKSRTSIKSYDDRISQTKSIHDKFGFKHNAHAFKRRRKESSMMKYSTNMWDMKI